MKIFGGALDEGLRSKSSTPLTILSLSNVTQEYTKDGNVKFYLLPSLMLSLY